MQANDQNVTGSASPEGFFGLTKHFVYKNKYSGEFSVTVSPQENPREEYITYFHSNPLNPADVRKKLIEIQSFHRKTPIIRVFKLASHGGSLVGEFAPSDVRYFNFVGCDFSGMDLRGFRFTGYFIDCDFSNANLQGVFDNSQTFENVNFSGANLVGAQFNEGKFQNVNFEGANLQSANFKRASFDYKTNFCSTDLRNVNFRRSRFDSGKHLFKKAKFSFQLPQKKELTVYKKLRHNMIATLIIPADAKRTASLVGKKCRAERAIVKEIYDRNGNKVETGISMHDSTFFYKVGETVEPTFFYKVGETVEPRTFHFNDNFTQECLPGIHFFMNHEDAKAYV